MKVGILISTAFLFCMVYGLLHGGYVDAETMGDELPGLGEGEAVVEKGDLANARNRALNEALQKAFEQALALLPSPLPADRAHEVIQRLAPKQKKFLIRYRILSEMPTTEGYRVSVSAVYSASLLKDDLSASGFLEKEGQYPVREVTLRVHNVSSFSSYHDLTEGCLKHLSAVMSFVPREVYGTELTLLIRIRGDAKTLGEALKTCRQGALRIGSIASTDEAAEIEILSTPDSSAHP